MKVKELKEYLEGVNEEMDVFCVDVDDNPISAYSCVEDCIEIFCKNDNHSVNGLYIRTN